MDARSHGRQVRALRRLLVALGDERHAPLIGTDFADIELARVEREFAQDVNGVRFSFVVSNHALGKVISAAELADALDGLLQSEDTDDSS